MLNEFGRDSHFTDFKFKKRVCMETEQQHNPKKIPYQEGFSYGLRLPALQTLQQWLHLRLKGLILLELVTLPDATTMRSLAPPALRNHEMPKHNQPSQLHAGSKLCSIFGIGFHLFLQSLFPHFLLHLSQTSHCLL